MGLWPDLKDRRIVQILVSYAAAGWLVLEGLSLLVERGVLPEVAFPAALVLYVAGIPASLVVGWYHGEKGQQRVNRTEVVLLSVIAVAAFSGVGVVLSGHQRGAEATEMADASSMDLRRVAVLSFRDLSSGEDLEYLTTGMTESVVDNLQRVPALEVVPARAVEGLEARDLPRDSVARLLRAGTLIDGSVDRRGDRFTITTRLVDGESGAEVTRGTFQVDRENLLATRDSLAREISRSLRTWLGDEIHQRTGRASTDDLDAWILVQRAETRRREASEELSHGRGEAGLAAYRAADSLLQSAAAADSTWVAPSVQRGWIAYRMSRYAAEAHGDVHRATELIDRGMDHARRVLAIEERHPEGLELRGTLRYWRWLLQVTPDPQERRRLLEQARQDLEEAVERDPTLASAYSTLSHLNYHVDDLTGTVLAARRAYEEDAYLDAADGVVWRLFNGTHDLGQFRQARRWCEIGTRRFPEDFRFSLCQLWLMTTPAVPPEPDRAWELVSRVDSQSPDQLRRYAGSLARVIAGGVLARADLPDSARSVLRRTRAGVDHHVDPTQELLSVEAYMRTLLGEEDEAIALLKRYVSANPDHTFETGSGEISWRWRPLLDHPDFDDLTGGT